MFDENDEIDRRHATRRNFLKLAGTGSFTAAVLAGAAGTLWSDSAAAQTANEEQERERAAEEVMTLATAYTMFADRSYPIMQLDMKENVQNLSGGRIYVKLAPAGQLGSANELVQKVQSGTIQAAQHSIANFAPYAPVVDLINLPYLCGSNQRFVNLVRSDHWTTTVHPQIEARGFKPLFYAIIDPRGVALRNSIDKPVLTPEDMRGIKFRVPGSEIMQTYYRMVGANPTPIAWGETPSAIQQGVADALDPSTGALYVFGFKDMLSHVTFTKAVPDAQVYSCNLEWFEGLPDDLREAVEFAAQVTGDQNLAKVPAARGYAMAELRRSGVEFHSLDDDQMAQWKEAGGFQRSEWDATKTHLAGSMAEFDKLAEAASTDGRAYVHDT
ncbi:TRAP transporter substrate-binding protein [Paracoccus sp. 1_MG-2023]|uniref:TRAP transporter substrate-binding protein n=1 Tax=unclassified Paracoccus (in: a-proteobacteria) TaxID=2688777 RepID=UPI001C086FDE|nr:MULTISPECIES: TRAP transporter substrate-binding protein [unclassified Paracoccus (in: a-proteobacteria)]MBU2957877.1 TRAP transporter substrate-binding protein [Paracoccus sp. C2R09]MDO6668930.1 TRAP transporter substrate-binding protein [Paracoccus sp. 1_MG-2023]